MIYNYNHPTNHINYRYRGPIESHKINHIFKNSEFLINKLWELVDKYINVIDDNITDIYELSYSLGNNYAKV